VFPLFLFSFYSQEKKGGGVPENKATEKETGT
jgi:hypothetical protein